MLVSAYRPPPTVSSTYVLQVIVPKLRFLLLVVVVVQHALLLVVAPTTARCRLDVLQLRHGRRCSRMRENSYSVSGAPEQRNEGRWSRKTKVERAGGSGAHAPSCFPPGRNLEIE